MTYTETDVDCESQLQENKGKTPIALLSISRLMWSKIKLCRYKKYGYQGADLSTGGGRTREANPVRAEQSY